MDATVLNQRVKRVLPLIQAGILGATTWRGVPAWKFPCDSWIYQQLIFQVQPDVIIEIGNKYGGTALYLQDLCDLFGKGRVIGVDVTHKHLYPQARDRQEITWIEGDACAMAERVGNSMDEHEVVMVIEDSAHTRANTLAVLEAYAPLVSPGSYFIVEDGIMGHGLDRDMPDGGPYEATRQFLERHPEFVVDRNCERYVLTWNPSGYLRRTRW
jgi:cephalosporin hydroxylase